MREVPCEEALQFLCLDTHFQETLWTLTPFVDPNLPGMSLATLSRTGYFPAGLQLAGVGVGGGGEGEGTGS